MYTYIYTHTYTYRVYIYIYIYKHHIKNCLYIIAIITDATYVAMMYINLNLFVAYVNQAALKVSYHIYYYGIIFIIELLYRIRFVPIILHNL